MKKIIALSFFIMFIFNCVTVTPTMYQKVGSTGGYSDIQLGENVFQVTFSGNGYTSSQRASDFSLLRSAEIALKNDYRYFIIIDSEKYSETSTYTTPTRSKTTGSAYKYGDNIYGDTQTTTYSGKTYIISKPRAINTIVCFKDKPEINGIVYNAQIIVNSIRNKYSIKNTE